MEVIFKGVKHGEKQPILIKEGGLYLVIDKAITEDGKDNYHIKVDEASTGVYPVSWFINLTKMREKYSAKVGYLPYSPEVGTGVRIVVNVLPEGSGKKKMETLYTSPVVKVEDFAPNWALIETKSHHWYIGCYNEKAFTNSCF